MSTTATYVVTIHEPGNVTSEARNIHTILTSTDNIQPASRVEVTATELSELVYLHKVHAYTVDPAFDGHVLGYLRTMAAEYGEQVASLEVLPANAADRAIALTHYTAKRDAYLDAVRVLADADDAAYRAATEATR